LATAFPEKVIETLMLEYIDMPKRTAISEITVETRIKLGEILVKTTKALGTQIFFLYYVRIYTAQIFYKSSFYLY